MTTVTEASASRSPSVTERISIRWGDGPAEEPTSTLVLTAPNGLFIDIRILKDKLETNDASAIDLAFAGISIRSEISATASGSWEHWVDSRTESPDSDSGTLETLVNGDELERGVMKNEDGVLTPYEEVWRDVPIELQPGPRSGPESSGYPISIYVAERDVDGRITPTNGYESVKDLKKDIIRGMIIWIGSWCQGIIKTTDSHNTSLERWEWREEGWKRTISIGDTWLPCAKVLHEVDPPSVMTDKDGGFTWIRVGGTS